MWPWVLRQDFLQHFHLIRSQSLLFQMCRYILWHHNLQSFPLSRIHKTTSGIRMRIGIHHIRLDVVDRSAIHQVSTLHMDNRSIGTIPLYPRKSNGRQADIVGAKRAASGKDAHLLISAQHRRTHYGTIRPMLVGRELPYQPQIIKALDTTQGIGISILRFKDNLSFQLFHQSCLLRYSKLTRKWRAKSCYWFYFHSFSIFSFKTYTLLYIRQHNAKIHYFCFSPKYAPNNFVLSAK